MSPVAVSKMHGTRNDFIVLDLRSQSVPDLSAFARAACDRRSGVGADGVVALLASDRAHSRMRIINADGSEAEMCGNGMRCAVRFLCEAGEGERFRIETLAGIIDAHVVEKTPEFNVRLNIGVPEFTERALPVPGARFVSLGNPHAVIFADSFEGMDIVQLGARIPDMNVHVAVVRDEHHLDVRHHERGVGPTHACGTGAVACAAAAIRQGRAASPVSVHVPGGVLQVEWDGEGTAYLTGAAVRVFDALI